jgi:DNA-binding GntR family transcriptional regulator
VNVATIDYEADMPVYRQLAEILKQRIKSGKLAPRRPVPSEKQLQDEFGVSRGTVRHAIAWLREEGFVYTVPQRGTYVSPREHRTGKTE